MLKQCVVLVTTKPVQIEQSLEKINNAVTTTPCKSKPTVKFKQFGYDQNVQLDKMYFFVVYNLVTAKPSQVTFFPTSLYLFFFWKQILGSENTFCRFGRLGRLDTLVNCFKVIGLESLVVSTICSFGQFD